MINVEIRKNHEIWTFGPYMITIDHLLDDGSCDSTTFYGMNMREPHVQKWLKACTKHGAWVTENSLILTNFNVKKFLRGM